MSMFSYLAYNTNKRVYFVGITNKIPSFECRKHTKGAVLIAEIRISDKEKFGKSFFEAAEPYKKAPAEYDFPSKHKAKLIFMEAAKSVKTEESVPLEKEDATSLGNFCAEMSIQQAADEFGYSYAGMYNMLTSDCFVIDGKIYRKVGMPKKGAGGRPSKYGFDEMEVGDVKTYPDFETWHLAKNSANGMNVRTRMTFEWSRGDLTITRIE